MAIDKYKKLVNLTILDEALRMLVSRALKSKTDLSSNTTVNSGSAVMNYGVTGVLPVANGGTGNTDLSKITVGAANNADTATKLQTARTIQTNLASTKSATFDGATNITPGVSGVLPVANGGTGSDSLSSITVGKASTADEATKLQTARDIQTNLSSNLSASFDGTDDITPGVSGILPVANGGTGSSSLSSITVGKATTADSAAKLSTARTISLTGNATGSTSFDGSGNATINTTVNVIASQGNKTAIKDGTAEPSGLQLYKVYQNGYPANYGNLISIGGLGGGELLAGWSGTDHGVEHLYYRNRKNNGTLWSDWNTIAFTSDINNYAPTKTGTGASGTWGISISGTATKATNDASGNNINSTYVKSVTYSGHTVTVTKGNGTTSTFNTADTNTTYPVATTTANGLMPSTDKTKLNGIATGAEVNQNAFSNITVGNTTIAADSKTDTLTLVAGSNITLTPDATNDKITIATTASVSDADLAKANAGSATKLQTARTIQTNLASTASASFDGTANITPGVTGVLPVANGGTGSSSLANITVGKATSDASGNVITDTYAKKTDITVKGIKVTGATSPLVPDSSGVVTIPNADMSNYATVSSLSSYQTKLTFDNTPTANSSNPVTSDGVKTAIDKSLSDFLDGCTTEAITNLWGTVKNADTTNY